MNIGHFTSKRLADYLGTIHILRNLNHIFRIFGPPPPLRKMFLALKIIKNWHFLTPSPPTSYYVIYEWSLMKWFM